MLNRELYPYPDILRSEILQRSPIDTSSIGLAQTLSGILCAHLAYQDILPRHLAHILTRFRSCTAPAKISLQQVLQSMVSTGLEQNTCAGCIISYKEILHRDPQMSSLVLRRDPTNRSCAGPAKLSRRDIQKMLPRHAIKRPCPKGLAQDFAETLEEILSEVLQACF